MFYYKFGLVRRIRIHPQYSGGKHDPQQMVRKMLKQDIRDNFFSSDQGYIVDRIAVEKIEDGYCIPLVGMIEFLVTFKAILLYPIVGEVVDAVVELVTDTCIIFRHACVFGVVRSYCLNDRDCFKYEERDVVPEDEKERSGSFKEGFFRSEIDSAKIIQKGTAIRLRLTQRTLGGNGFFLIGSMSSEYLGPLINPPPVPVTKITVKKKLILPSVKEIDITLEERQKILKQRLYFIDPTEPKKEENCDSNDNISIASLQLDP